MLGALKEMLQSKKAIAFYAGMMMFWGASPNFEHRTAVAGFGPTRPAGRSPVEFEPDKVRAIAAANRGVERTLVAHDAPPAKIAKEMSKVHSPFVEVRALVKQFTRQGKDVLAIDRLDFK